MTVTASDGGGLTAFYPEQTPRLFPLHGPAVLPEPTEPVSDFVIGRVLEEGEEADLQWLTGRVSEARLVEWLGQRGRRQLSRRSYLFWHLVLGLPSSSALNLRARDAQLPDDDASIREALWPL